jgi:hypothetical protein
MSGASASCILADPSAPAVGAVALAHGQAVCLIYVPLFARLRFQRTSFSHEHYPIVGVVNRLARATGHSHVATLIVVILRAVGWHSRIPSHPVRYSVTVWMHTSGVHVVRPYVSHEMVATPLCSPAAGMRHMYETEPPRVRAQAHPSVVQEYAVWATAA